MKLPISFKHLPNQFFSKKIKSSHNILRAIDFQIDLHSTQKWYMIYDTEFQDKKK